MATLNLYVSDDLKAQMDEHDDINWSGIAQQAFKASIADKQLRLQAERRREGIRPGQQIRSAPRSFESIAALDRVIVEERQREAERNPRYGIYRLAVVPTRLAAHNVGSWRIIQAMLESRGTVEFERLADAVRDHKPRGGQAFVQYCIRNAWLERAGTVEDTWRVRAIK